MAESIEITSIWKDQKRRYMDEVVLNLMDTGRRRCRLKSSADFKPFCDAATDKT